MYYYKITFSPKQYRVCCIMQIINNHKEIFNIPFSKVSALILDGIPIIAIYFFNTITHNEYLDFIYILNSIIPMNNTKIKFIKSYSEDIYEDYIIE